MALTAERRRPVPHKKRAAQHHKKNQRYLKHYWPYLPMLAIVGAGLLLNTLWPRTMSVLGAHNDLSPSQMVIDTNRVRTQAGENSLSLEPRLIAAAQAKANDMVSRNYWSHNTPTGEAPWSFVSGAGYSYRIAGENLAFGFTNADQVMKGWMQSPEHRANILNQSYSQVGFATATSSNYVGKGPETIVVAMYASPGDVTAAPSTVQSNTPTNIQSGTINSRPVSRLASISPTTNLIPMFVAVLTSLSVVIFLTRHARFLHRNLVRGEVFIISHPLFDICLVAVATLGIIISQTSAFIL